MVAVVHDDEHEGGDAAVGGVVGRQGEGQHLRCGREVDVVVVVVVAQAARPAKGLGGGRLRRRRSARFRYGQIRRRVENA